MKKKDTRPFKSHELLNRQACFYIGDTMPSDTFISSPTLIMTPNSDVSMTARLTLGVPGAGRGFHLKDDGTNKKNN